MQRRGQLCLILCVTPARHAQALVQGQAQRHLPRPLVSLPQTVVQRQMQCFETRSARVTTGM